MSNIARGRPLLARQRASEYAERVVTNPFAAYALIVVLQLRTIWNIWRFADLTNGDSSFYFIDAASWAHGLHENLVYYPLYDAFWGTILALVHNVYAATIIHRLVIVFAVTLLVLALMRALLGPALGLLIAAWWAIVPVNYDPLYEIHLFGALPVLIVLLVVAYVPRRQGLGVAVAILIASAVVVRTELIAGAVVLAGVAFAYELREWRAGRASSRRVYARAYVIPLAVACLVIGGAYARSYTQGSSAWRLLKAKEESNFCESYANSFQQRHPSEFTGNPFSECSPLMQQTFGKPMPTLLQGIDANPKAVAAFGAWNAHLLPSGLQVSLLGATALETNPGFTPVTINSRYALALAELLLILVVVGLVVLAKAGELSWRGMPSRTRLLIVTLVAIAVTDVLVVLTVRPWAEYIYGLSICTVLLVGVSVSALVRGLGAMRLLAPSVLAVVLILIVVASSPYGPGTRPIDEGVEHLQVVQKQLQQSGSVLVAGENYNVLCNYLAYSYNRRCNALYWETLRSQVTPRLSAGQVLDRVHATALYADGGLLTDPIIAQLLAAPRAQGWQLAARGSGPGGPWQVLVPVGHPS